MPTTTGTPLPPRLSDEHLKSLNDHGWVVVPDFLSTATTTGLRDDLLQLRKAKCFSVAKIGQDGIIQDEQTPFRDIRHSETCALMMNNSNSRNLVGEEEEFKQGGVPPPPLLKENAARTELYEILNALRRDLQQCNNAASCGTTTLELDETLEEVMYAYYPVGGYYRRHVDAEHHSPSAWRQYSFLLYLNDKNDWHVDLDGGQLRLHRDSGGDEPPVGELPNFLDVAPQGGTLVVFKSNVVPHEVLPTNKERTAVVGWFLAKDLKPNDNKSVEESSTSPTYNSSNSCIRPDVLVALRALRQAVPGLERKLEPIAPPTNDQSGMLWNEDFGIIDVTNTPSTAPHTTTPAATPESFPDTDPRYWKAIAALDEEGKISTLSLGGQRLRKLQDPSNLLAPDLWQSVVTVDLANTDLPVPLLCQVLDQMKEESSSLTQLYLGGNALGGGASLAEVVPHLTAAAISTLQVLDLRYNDLGPADAAVLSKFLQEDACRCEKLYLEGNALGDEGAQHLVGSAGSSSPLRELYLGQNRIGPTGAAALAQSLPGSKLEKLYLEGNCIGPEGARSFIEVLEKAASNSAANDGGVALQKLYVDNNNMGKKEAVRLGAALHSATVIGDTHLFEDE